MVLKISRQKVPTTGTLLTNAVSVSPTWRIPNRPAAIEFEPRYPTDPTLALDCPLFELTESGAALWLLADVWTPDEAALLLAGANPKLIQAFDLDPNIYKPDFTSCGYLGLRDLLARAYVSGALGPQCGPRAVVAWAAGKGLRLPDILRTLLQAPGQTVTVAPTATPVSTPTINPAPATDTAPTAGPMPVNTRAMADSFAGLRGWSGQRWVKALGDKPVWLGVCIVSHRGRGEGSRQWNPVLIGGYLVRMGHAKANSVRAKFQTEEALKPWLEKWKTYEADNF